MRGQVSLPAFGIALLIVTGGVVIGITTADAALANADRSPLERQAAVSLSERLVRADAPVAARANVVDGSALSNLSTADLRDRYGLSEDVAVTVRLDDRTLISAADPSDGTTIERIVLVERRENRTLRPALDRARTVTLPRRTPSITLTLRPPENTTVRTVRINGRVRLHNTSGLSGTYDLPVSTAQTAQVQFDALGPLADDSVSIQYYPALTEKARLGVTVDG